MNDPTATIKSASLLGTVKHYMELIRFSHTIFALPFALLATIWAILVPIAPSGSGTGQRYITVRWQEIVGVVLCMVTARSFAMAMNRLLDQKLDGENPRTANRHLPSKTLQSSSVAWFSYGCAAAFVVCCLLFLPNILPIALSVPVLLFLAGYSLAKRFTYLVHFWLGLALMLAPICAWLALRGEQVMSQPSDLLPATLLGLVVLFWVTGFDIVYACQDYEFDKKSKLYSIPAFLGIRNAIASCRHVPYTHVVHRVFLDYFTPELSLGWMFRGMLGCIAILLVIEHSVVSEKSLAKIQIAFFQLNSIISVLFLVVGSLDAYLK